MDCLQAWPEPIVRVQSLAESGIDKIPDRYIKPPSQRPTIVTSPETNSNYFNNNNDNNNNNNNNSFDSFDFGDVNIPVIDFQSLSSDEEMLRSVSEACRKWGFFQVVNHGVSHELMKKARDTWREFFNLPLEVKQEYANSPKTYEGYGSRLGVEKGVVLDWSDYFFLNYMPPSLRNSSKWPALPLSCRKVIAEYGEEVAKLGWKLLKILSINLGLKEDCLQKAFGGEENVDACLRVNFYPKCPQPDLTLGLSSHSDPGGMTILLPDELVPGLQVRKGDVWVTVKPVPNAFIVNIGDQLQVLSNAIYKSVEHRVIVNSLKDRVSLAFFYNPKSDLLIEPEKELVTKERPALYQPMTFGEYRLHMRTKGPCGKQQVESLISPRSN
ncbi:2-oxoglutarate (2OG) and Fe(II)-dependent oxygenase superfamily protein [Quillaja saponaria]|uniref:2-oxoglutarate (2OG) and Fe(II)-dependent oxygenase superfamily protein n=1 Tax=Quillaja saponaria TaxID=32244 RepID=A0AAD7L1Z7_QUISA|nr:2-oxoglutarate (2OG) and Fe(II)-dependent oxygenase superfamily protein [Quillaja saponaria]